MDEQSLSEEVKENVTDGHIWMRLLFMLLFAFIYSVAEIVLMAVVAFQFLAVLFTSDKNERLLDFGRQLSTFIYQMLDYLTFNSEQRPFPFDDWPSGGE